MVSKSERLKLLVWVVMQGCRFRKQELMQALLYERVQEAVVWLRAGKDPGLYGMETECLKRVEVTVVGW